MGKESKKPGMVLDIQKFSVHDGPGIRTLVFMKGCPLRCRWCSNPESISRHYQIMFLGDKCSDCSACVPVCPKGLHRMGKTQAGDPVHRVIRSKGCTGCGACVTACPAGALRVAGREMSVAEVMQVVGEDCSFYFSSGGGITVGGGEPTAQPEFVGALLSESKKAGIHTAVETCGYASWRTYERLVPLTDLFLFDLKHPDPEQHLKWTGVDNRIILDNLARLLKSANGVVVRMPLMAGVNDQKRFLRQSLTYLEKMSKSHGALKGVELLPFHRLGFNKYGQLGADNTLADLRPHSAGKLADIEALVRSFDLPVRIVRM